MHLQLFAAIAHVGAALGPHVISIGTKVVSSLTGGVTADEAQALAEGASAEAGDIKVKVKGVDIVDDEAQKLLAGFIGRVVRNAVTALK